jgi:hypothetical protein
MSEIPRDSRLASYYWAGFIGYRLEGIDVEEEESHKRGFEVLRNEFFGVLSVRKLFDYNSYMRLPRWLYTSLSIS